MHPLDRFYRVRFANEQVLHDWSLRVIETVAAREDLDATVADSRPVVFISLRAGRRGPVYAYVNEAALDLVDSLVHGVGLDGMTMPMRDLPDWLGPLIGDPTDATAYERRDLDDV